MKIKIEKYGDGYKADFIELCGSPLIGTGKTKEESVANLFIVNQDRFNELDFNSVQIIK
jgi:hypothetical protein